MIEIKIDNQTAMTGAFRRLAATAGNLRPALDDIGERLAESTKAFPTPVGMNHHRLTNRLECGRQRHRRIRQCFKLCLNCANVPDINFQHELYSQIQVGEVWKFSESTLTCNACMEGLPASHPPYLNVPHVWEDAPS